MSDESAYAALADEARALLSGESDRIANAANLASLIYHRIADVNWAGFYFVDGDELLVGPFCGQPACTRIAFGRGVCGTAWARGQTLRVDDVHAFDGHIACDPESRSELVVPLIQGGEGAIGVLDIDSPVLARFDVGDQRGIERLAAIYLDSIG